MNGQENILIAGDDMVDKNSKQYLKSTLRIGYYGNPDGSIQYKHDVSVSGNSAYSVALLTNRL